MHGRRNRSKSRALWQVRARVRAIEAEEPALGPPPENDSPGLQAAVAAMRQPTWRTPLLGLPQAGPRYFAVKAWARKHFGLLVLASWALMLLFYFLTTGEWPLLAGGPGTPGQGRQGAAACCGHTPALPSPPPHRPTLPGPLPTPDRGFSPPRALRAPLLKSRSPLLPKKIGVRFASRRVTGFLVNNFVTSSMFKRCAATPSV